MKIKKIIALLLCLALFCTLFAGCGDKSEKGDSSSSGASSSSSSEKDNGKTEDISADTSYGEFVYVPTYQDLGLPEKTQINNIYFANDMFYLICEEVIGQKTEYWNGDAYVPYDGEGILKGEDTAVNGTDDTADTDTEGDVDVDPDVPEEGEGEYYTYDVYGNAIYTMNADFSNVRRIENFVPTTIPEGYQGNCYISSFCVGKDGTIWLCENEYMYHYGENFEYISDGDNFYLRHVDAEGNDICRILANELFPETEYLYVDGVAVTDDGGCIINDGNSNTTMVLDAQGQKLFTISVPYYINSYVTLGDGKIYATYYGDTGFALAPVDLTAKGFGEEIKVPSNVWNIIPGSELYDFYYNTELELFGYDFETGESTKLINWISSDVDTNEMSNICVKPDGTICAIFCDWTGEYPIYQLASFVKADPATLPEKITLTLGCMYLDYSLRTEVIKFNRSSDKYRIEFIDYSQYNTEDDYNAGTTKLNAEIISGKAPDILVSNALAMETYASKGLFVDLYEYIDKDPELSRDQLVEGALKAYEYDGKLYEAFPSFYINTVVGPTSAVGAEPGWTINELLDLQRQLPAGMQIFCNRTRSDMLYTIMRMNLDSYVDWTDGTCKFDTGEFAGMLEFANSFPLEFDWETEYVQENTAIAKGQCLLSEAYVYDFRDLNRYKCLYNGDITCIGFPSENSCGSSITCDSSLAITSTCKDKDGAWSFVRNVFTEEYQTENYWYGFMTNKKVMEQKIEEAMHQEYYTNENGENVPMPYEDWEGDGYHILTYACEQEDIDLILNLIDAIGESGTRTGYDQDIYEIIQTESEYYFNGQKSADEVANIIQSRVKIYVSEHML